MLLNPASVPHNSSRVFGVVNEVEKQRIATARSHKRVR